MDMAPTPDRVLPGQESVWSFPRPAIAQPSMRHLRIVHGSGIIAKTRSAVRTIETSHPPTYCFPRPDVHATLVGFDKLTGPSRSGPVPSGSVMLPDLLPPMRSAPAPGMRVAFDG